MNQTQAKPGIAYGVYKCMDPRPKPELLARFKDALENIKAAHEETGIRPDTIFEVHGIEEGKIAFQGEEGLIGHIEAVESKGANFVIRSSLDGAGNLIAARDLGDAFNMLYGATELFDAENEGRAKLVMEIFYRDGGGGFVSKLEAEPPGR